MNLAILIVVFILTGIFIAAGYSMLHEKLTEKIIGHTFSVRRRDRIVPELMSTWTIHSIAYASLMLIYMAFFNDGCDFPQLGRCYDEPSFLNFLMTPISAYVYSMPHLLIAWTGYKMVSSARTDEEKHVDDNLRFEIMAGITFIVLLLGISFIIRPVGWLLNSADIVYMSDMGIILSIAMLMFGWMLGFVSHALTAVGHVVYSAARDVMLSAASSGGSDGAAFTKRDAMNNSPDAVRENRDVREEAMYDLMDEFEEWDRKIRKEKAELDGLSVPGSSTPIMDNRGTNPASHHIGTHLEEQESWT